MNVSCDDRQPADGAGVDPGSVTTDPYYDPFDFDIDIDDPYPVWKRLREEAPLYYNEKMNFFALSRFSDVSVRRIAADANDRLPAWHSRAGPVGHPG